MTPDEMRHMYPGYAEKEHVLDRKEKPMNLEETIDKLFFLTATEPDLNDIRFREVLQNAQSYMADMKEDLEATLLFFSPGWTEEKADRYEEITGTRDCLSKTLCDHIRKVMANGTETVQEVPMSDDVQATMGDISAF